MLSITPGSWFLAERGMLPLYQEIRRVSGDGVTQRSDAVNGNLDGVAGMEREGIRRNNSRTGQQETAVGKAGFAEQILHQLGGAALHGGESGGIGKDAGAFAENVHADFSGRGKRLGRDQDGGAEGAGTVVAL